MLAARFAYLTFAASAYVAARGILARIVSLSIKLPDSCGIDYGIRGQTTDERTEITTDLADKVISNN